MLLLRVFVCVGIVIAGPIVIFRVSDMFCVIINHNWWTLSYLCDRPDDSPEEMAIMCSNLHVGGDTQEDHIDDMDLDCITSK